MVLPTEASVITSRYVSRAHFQVARGAPRVPGRKWVSESVADDLTAPSPEFSGGDQLRADGASEKIAHPAVQTVILPHGNGPDQERLMLVSCGAEFCDQPFSPFENLLRQCAVAHCLRLVHVAKSLMETALKYQCYSTIAATWAIIDMENAKSRSGIIRIQINESMIEIMDWPSQHEYIR